MPNVYARTFGIGCADMNNLLSIVTVNYNNVEGLRYTAKSIAEQSEQDFEWIVIDAASTDGSVSVIKEYKSYITYTVSEKDKGIYDGMNKGIAKSTGKYVLFLNSGDALASNDVIKNIYSLELSGDVVVGAVNVCDSNHNIVTYNHSIGKRELTLFNFFLWGIPHQATLIKRDLLNDFGGYDQSAGMNADWKFFLDTVILTNKSLQRIECIIANYDNSGISSVNIDKVREERMQIFKNSVPQRIVADYIKVFPVYYEVYRVEWLLKHRFFYKIYRGITTIGRKLLGDK